MSGSSASIGIQDKKGNEGTEKDNKEYNNKGNEATNKNDKDDKNKNPGGLKVPHSKSLPKITPKSEDNKVNERTEKDNKEDNDKSNEATNKNNKEDKSTNPKSGDNLVIPKSCDENISQIA